jgi:tetraacyldisaccharide 4'-kinase
MRRWLDQLEQFAIEVILEKRFGKRAALFRLFLLGLSKIFGRLVHLRLQLYRERILRERQLGVMVISIGNLTVGGTGKTPVVEKFARALTDGGRTVAILSRGYKSKRPPLLRRIVGRLKGDVSWSQPRVVADGKQLLLDSATAGDEPYMLARNLKNVVVVVDKDRVKAGLYAIKHFKADTLLLDDGFQYLKLKHRLDVVLIDRQQPFGNEFMLPRGTLREPPENLKRARYIFITKSLPSGNADLIERIRRYNRTAEIIECTHRPLHLQNIFTDETKPLEYLQDRWIGALSAIAAPWSFESALTDLGAKLDLAKRFTDHYRFTEKDITTFVERCARRDLDAIITTEKDAVRIPRIEGLDLPIYYLRVEIEILSGHESWEACVRRICQPQEMLAPERFYL